MARPQLFPSLTDPEKKVNLRDGMMVKAVSTVAVLFAAQIILGNQAYLYANISFLQMLKESNIVWVYLLSILFGMEVFKSRQMVIICLITVATFMTVHGELSLTMVGLSLQATCCLAESLKITLQGVLLSSTGRGLDTFSYMLLVMPVCACLFGTILMFVAIAIPEQQILPMPHWADVVLMKWELLANACVALMLNISCFVFIRCSSAVSYVLAGVMKDVCIVFTGIIFMGNVSSPLQLSGFSLQLVLVLTWSLLKTFPKEFEHSLLDGFAIVFMGKKSSPDKVDKAEHAKEASADAEANYGAIKHNDSRLTRTAGTNGIP